MINPIKQLTLTPALTELVKDVFGPTAKLLGTELRSCLKQSFDDARERRRNQNIKSHISAVRASLPKPPPDSMPYERLELFSGWIEGAQDVGEEERILSELWRQLLRDIVGGRHIPKSLIDVMKQLNSPMAAVLLKFQRYPDHLIDYAIPPFPHITVKRLDENLFHAKRLEAIGLLERDYTRLVVAILITAVFLIGEYFALDYIRANNLLKDSSSPILQPAKFLSLLCIVIFGYISFSSSISCPSFRLTWTGRELLKYVTKPTEETVPSKSDATNGT